ncbi:hypothetical protein V6N13_075089 [Hibiscus sabdariffa]|uniref:Disease resistance protein At4g27190-like leucine-rich repeats domain-containing protein n=1 Tax=Hibiscus sabdariffa TaxID=183260 RepID=A0ABR2UAR6_9ROSI
MDDLPYNGEQNQEKPLSNLQSLELLYLQELRCIFKGLAHSFSLQSLKVVSIEKCSKLESLFSPSLIQSLGMLEEFRISACDGLETLITEQENNNVETESNSSVPSLFPRRLKTLDISGCPKLEYALPITSAKDLPALAMISVSHCGALKQVFGTVKEQNGVEQDGIMCLDNLQDLRLCFLRNLSCFAPENYIFKVPALESLKVDECPQFMNFAISRVDKQLHLKRPGLSSKLKDLPLEGWEVLENLEPLIVTGFEQPLLSNIEHLKLEYLSELRWIVKVPAHSVSFQGLLVLEIVGCRQLKSLFSLSAIQTISSLEELRIANCNELKSVFMELEGIGNDKIESSTLYLPNLKTVAISECGNAEYVFPLALAGGLPCLQEIHLHGLENLSSFFAQNNIMEAPALKILRVCDCPRFTSFIIQKDANKCVSLKELDLHPMSCNMESVPLTQRSQDFECLAVGNFEQLFQLQGGFSFSNLESLKIFNMIWLRDMEGWHPICNKSQKTEHRLLPWLDIHLSNDAHPTFSTFELPKNRLLRELEQIIAIDDILASSSQGKKMEFPQLEEMHLYRLPSLVSFSPLGYHLVFPSLKYLMVSNCDKMITCFMIHYLTMAVHATTDQASPLARGYIDWDKRRPKTLPQYVEEAGDNSTLKLKIVAN